MARNKDNAPDDPFGDESWGMPDAQHNAPLDTMPEVPSEVRLDFLKPATVGRATFGEIELTGVSRETSKYSDVILLVKFRGRPFRIGLRTFSPDYQSLLKKFGKNPNDWKGTIRYKVMPHNGRADGYIGLRA